MDPTVEPAWDRWIEAYPEGSFFHGSAWAAVLKQTYRHRPAYLVVRSEGDGRALWPIMELNGGLTGRRGVSLPFTDLCEPLVATTMQGEELLSAALETGRSRHWRYFEFRGGQRHFPAIRPAYSCFTHTLPLCRETDLLLRRCGGSVRQAIRKARREGVRVEISRAEEAVRDYYSLHCRTRRKHGLPPQPYDFFRAIHQHVLAPGRGVVITARHQGRAIAAAIFFHQRGRAIYKFGASDESRQDLRGNNLVMWAGIEHFALQGCQDLCFGRTSAANEGLRRYKLGWGTEERELNYYKYDFRANAFVQDLDRAAGWHNHVFRVLPGFLSKWIGAALYRHWA
jgi:lipid II:glycine glycyltransferase (peptidoglycan interpeptide bridge formation enzyme)